MPVSIHAPTWGATKVRAYNGFKFEVSIHAPTWGATQVPTIIYLQSQVSIHAPTWGATVSNAIFEFLTTGFNPRAHVGRDWASSTTNNAPFGFNPRAHVGRDYFESESLDFVVLVSIHAPTWGATKCRASHDAVPGLFQSTRPRGARHNLYATICGSWAFQSTRPRGARLVEGLRLIRNIYRFNPRAHVGRDCNYH